VGQSRGGVCVHGHQGIDLEIGATDEQLQRTVVVVMNSIMMRGGLEGRMMLTRMIRMMMLFMMVVIASTASEPAHIYSI
jgi:hypothetical protein